jgi:peptidylprolyl isomerase
VKMRVIVLALCIALALAAAGCGGSSDSSSASPETSAKKEASAKEKGSASKEASSSPKASSAATRTKPTVTVPKQIAPTKYATREDIEGTGPEAKAGDQVTVQYVGVGYDSEEEFDSSWSRNEPLTFTLGVGEVIKGWDRGIQGMKVGGRRELLIPANLGYGAAGSPPKIAPNEALVFVVDLLAVE